MDGIFRGYLYFQEKKRLREQTYGSIVSSISINFSSTNVTQKYFFSSKIKYIYSFISKLSYSDVSRIQIPKTLAYNTFFIKKNVDK